uniref:DUF6598 domain-containing protein n=1 Tax=Oryza nivara TaxID=4536 RepID=A0A0E0I9K7_ORYNI
MAVAQRWQWWLKLDGGKLMPLVSLATSNDDVKLIGSACNESCHVWMKIETEIGRVMDLFFTDGVLGLDGGVSPEEEEEVEVDLEPLFYDEAATVAESVAAAERRRVREEDRARVVEQQTKVRKAKEAYFKKNRKFNPKTGLHYFTRIFFINPLTFDLNEESPLGPMRYTDRIYNEHEALRMRNSVNILSVKILSSDVGFPINVYGTVIARDSLDEKCIYLFRRPRDDCQLINSKDDSLILTGPTRGLVLQDAVYFEVDLRIKDDRLRGKKKEHSKGLLMIDGIRRTIKVKTEVENDTFVGKLGTVELRYAVIKDAVEATVEIKVVEGYFCGEVAACTTNIQDKVVLLDSRTCCVMADNLDVQLSRRVMAVHNKEKLLLTVVNQDDEVPTGCVTQTIDFTPKFNGSDVTEVTCGSVKMLVKVTWSLMV